MFDALKSPRFHRRAGQWLVVLGGAVALQTYLIGPSLTNRKVLLPLGILAQPHVYITVPEGRLPHDDSHQSPVFSDQVLNYEYSRWFALSEFRAGRVPVWDPNSYAGTPFTHYGKYSPFNWLYFAFPVPMTLAWMHLAKCLVATAGAYAFFRRVLGVRFWPAAVGAWCYPMTGFFVLWQGFPISYVTAWYPALLTAVAVTVRRPFGAGPAGVAAFSALTVLAGHADVGAQVLVASGLFGVWCLVRRHRRAVPRATAVRAAALAVGWGAGLGLSGPYLLPLLAYAKTGQRIALRDQGTEERPPGTASNLGQMLVPDWEGSHRLNAVYAGPGNQIEGPAGAYAGLLAALVAAPLAWGSRPRRGLNWFWVGTGLLGTAWTLGLPVVVQVLRAPGLNMVSHNRFVFVTGFAVLALAVTGLNAAWGGSARRRVWHVGPAVALVALGAAAQARFAETPDAVESAIAGLSTIPQQQDALDWFDVTCMTAVLLCGVGLAAWAAVAIQSVGAAWRRALAVGMVFELLVWAAGYNPESDPSLYYPSVKVLEQIREAGDGRALGVLCLPADLLPRVGLRDLRGYDGIDPLPMLAALDAARAKSDQSPSYARTQLYLPRMSASAEALTLPPIVNMLNVRYLVARISLKRTPVWEAEGYAVYENPGALPRAYVPTRVRVVTDDAAALKAVSDPGFDPRAEAILTAPVEVPTAATGTATVAEPKPTEVVVTADVPGGGLVVLADQWAEGWSATVDGHPAEVVRVNYTLKGVVVPAAKGPSVVVFRYWPPGLTRGLFAAGAAVVLLGAWAAASVGRR